MAIVECEATVNAREGLHARPASQLVKAVQESGHKVDILKSGSDPVDASSILSLLTLGVKGGEKIQLRVDGDQAQSVTDRLVALLETETD